MKKLDYETPELTEAEYGRFVQGDSRNAPGKADNEEHTTNDIF